MGSVGIHKLFKRVKRVYRSKTKDKMKNVDLKNILIMLNFSLILLAFLYVYYTNKRIEALENQTKVIQVHFMGTKDSKDE